MTQATFSRIYLRLCRISVKCLLWSENDFVYRRDNSCIFDDDCSSSSRKACRCHWGWFKFDKKWAPNYFEWKITRNSSPDWYPGGHVWAWCLRTLSRPGCCCPGGPHSTRPPSPGSSHPTRARWSQWWGWITGRSVVWCDCVLHLRLPIRLDHKIFSFCVLKHIYCFSLRMNYKCCYSGRGETQALSRKFLRNEILQVLRHRESAVRQETTPRSRDPVFLDP